MLTLANVPLILPTPSISAYVRDTIPPDRAMQLVTRSWPGFGMVGLATPTGYRVPYRVELNRFLWPAGASRWFTGYCLCDTDQLEIIRDTAYGEDGTELNEITLSLSSPDETGATNETMTTKVYLLPPTPLARLDPVDGESVNGLWLLTLVDERFYWWRYTAPDFGINDSAGVTWTTLFQKIGTALGDITINVGTINTAYLQPGRGLNLTNEKLPQIFDAAAASIGHVVVRKLDGTVWTQPFAQAQETYQADVDASPWRSLRAGQDRFLDEL